ncbi:MAG: DUF4349 domain-containing protein [Candidatus Aenigmarchaeota archaeon]|nr:DUF4349 domain-containing protein [Candidatus Aenigmarchaeota archaeon]
MQIQELLTRRNAVIAVLVIFALIFAANFLSLPSDSSYATSGSQALGNTYASSSGEAPGEIADFGSSLIGQQKLIITAVLKLETTEFSKTVEEIRHVAFRFGGFVGESNLNLAERKTGFVVIKIPKESFEDALNDLRRIATLKEEKSSLQDVTEEFVDLESRLKNLKATETRFLTLFDKAETVNEILEVERALSSIREQIETLEGRKKFLEARTDFATITVNVEEPGQAKFLPDLDFQKPFQRAYASFFATIFLLIELAGVVIPLILIFSLVWKFYIKFSGKKRK